MGLKIALKWLLISLLPDLCLLFKGTHSEPLKPCKAFAARPGAI